MVFFAESKEEKTIRRGGVEEPYEVAEIKKFEGTN
jgi:hypothetical protein